MDRNRLRPRSSHVRSVALVALAAMLGVAALVIAVQPRAVGAVAFTTGDTVVIDTAALNLRASASLSSNVVAVLGNGAIATVTAGPQSAGGHDWYKLAVEDGSMGWAAGDLLALAAATDPGFAAGDAVVVTGGSLNLRADATLGADVVAAMPNGTLATVLSGPVTADGLPWYELDTAGYGQGWSAAGFLVASGGSASAASGGAPFASGAILFVMAGGDRLNLRSAASLSATVVAKLPQSSRVVVTGGPVTKDGYDWYRLDTDFGSGWSAGAFLVHPTDAIAIGDQVTVVDGTLNLRSAAGVAAEVLAKLPQGTALQVTDGPQSADGSTWYQVLSSDFGAGWAAGEYFALPTSGGETLATATATATVAAASVPGGTPAAT